MIYKKIIRKYKRQIIISLIMFYFIMSFQIHNSPSVILKAEELKGEVPSHEVLFLLDVSGSMKETGAGENSKEFLKNAVEMFSFTQTKMGMLAYNHTVAFKYSLTNLSNSLERTDLKEYMSEIKFSGDTDIGLGLMAAVTELSQENLSNPSEQRSNKIIILISDGETDLPASRHKRTNEESKEEEEQALQIAKQNGIRIYTIGLAKGFDGKTDSLIRLAKETNGSFSMANSMVQMYEVLQNIIQENYLTVTDFSISRAKQVEDQEPKEADTVKKEDLKSAKSDSAETIFDKWDITIPGNQFSQVSFLFFVRDLEEIPKIQSNSRDITVSQEGETLLVRIREPVEETISIYFSEQADISQTTAFTTGFYQLGTILYTEESVMKKNPAEIRLVFYHSETQEIIQDKAFYESINVNFYITQEATNEIKKLPAKAGQDGCTAVYDSVVSGHFSVYAEYNNAFLNGKTEKSIIQIMNQAPQVQKAIQKTIPGKYMESEINIEGLFFDPEADVLSYQMVEPNSSSVRLEGNTLYVKPQTYGEIKYFIKAVDTDQAEVIAVIEIKSVPVWKFYWNITVIVAIAVILLIAGIVSIIILRHYRKKPQKLEIEKQKEETYLRGSLVGYFIKTADDEEIEPLKWNLSQYHKKSLTLKELLIEKNVGASLPDTDKIKFQAKNETTLLFSHQLSGLVLAGAREVKRREETELKFGEKVYICLEEEQTELEIRYRSA